MSRYNIFFPIHKGLRPMLYETALPLQQTTFTDSEEADEMIDRLKCVIHFFEKHAATEDSMVFPAIAAYETSIVDAFEQEHDEDHALGKQLETLIAALETTNPPLLRQKIGDELTIAFIHFVAFNLAHMAKEEDVINNLLWRYYSDAELEVLSQKIISSISPAHMAMSSKWMLRGMSNAEIAGWLKQVKNTAPAPVCYQLIALAEKELCAHRWNAIQDALTDGAMVA